MDVAATGSTGLIGTALVKSLLGGGHRVARLVRPGTRAQGPPHGPGDHDGDGGTDAIAWDIDAGTVDSEALEGLDAVVHLAGAGIGENRWSPKRKSRLLRSRTESTQLLCNALASLSRPPSALISGSAIGVYGAHRGDEELTEGSATRSDDFLAALCERWEESTQSAEVAGIRVVHLRTGLVLDGEGGVLARQLLPFKLGLGGRVGPGDQWLSWISLRDEVAAIEHLLTASEVSGPVNVTAPTPVRQREFATTLGKVLHRPTLLPTPLWPLRIVLTSEMVDATLLASQRVLPDRLTADGFAFEHSELEPALRSVLNRPA